MAYLDPSEYEEYCGTEVTVTDADVKYATGLINAIIGKSLESTEATEMLRLKKDDSGKLRYTPVISVSKVIGVNITPTGATESELPVASVYLMDDYGRFRFFAGMGINSMVWGSPSNLKVTYNYGYAVIPEDIKVVTAAIAKNIVKIDSISGLSGAKSIASLDFTIAMFDDRLFSSNELLILQKYKVV